MKQLLTLFLGLCIATACLAWEPTKPVTVVIGFSPGSGNELSFRGFSILIEKSNPKINFVINNKPGADGVVGMNHFIGLPADGHHIYVASHQGIWITANANVKRYTLDDFEYVLTMAKSPLAIIASNTSTIQTAESFVAHLRTTKTPVNIAIGSSGHKLVYEYIMHTIFGNKALIKTVSYKGPAQASQDVAGGHVEFGIVPVSVANTLLKSGKIRILAITSEQRLDNLPEVPLLNTLIPGANNYAAWGILLPKNTPNVIVEWYVNTFRTAITSSEGKRFMQDNLMFTVPVEHTPKGFHNSMMQLQAKWIPILQAIGWSNE